MTEAIHFTGDWAVRFLWITLAVTPLAGSSWPAWLIWRGARWGLRPSPMRLLHLSLYALDQTFDLAMVASEIVMRFYLTIGFVALSCDRSGRDLVRPR